MITQRKNTLLFKLVAIMFLSGICLAASFSVLVLVMERSSRAGEARSEIAAGWAREQTLTGPIITIPIRKTAVISTGQQTVSEDFIFLLPEQLDYGVSLETDTLSRGIFDAAVYTSNIKGSGTFNLDDIDYSQVDGAIQWSDARLSIGIPDTRGIESSVELEWNGKKTAFEPGVSANVIGSSGISAPLHIPQNTKEHTFSFELVLRGSQEINFVPFGKTTNVSLSSNWQAPSFTGAFLPKERELSDAGFTAQWTVSSFGRSIPQAWIGASAISNRLIEDNIQTSTFGAALHQEVDFYTQVNRAVKYSVLFIVLTFLVFFLFEIFSHLRIHPLNYLLVGLAIALFFLLLLSLSEQVGFLPAYIVSTLATTGLITGYARSVLKAKKRAGIIAALLMALYSYLYILLQLDELSLIFGSVFLFGILAIVMYITRNIDWYAISEME